jgi:hypothetical protein
VSPRPKGLDGGDAALLHARFSLPKSRLSQSIPCGDNVHRNWLLKKDLRETASERLTENALQVAPCPKGVACITVSPIAALNYPETARL